MRDDPREVCVLIDREFFLAALLRRLRASSANERGRDLLRINTGLPAQGHLQGLELRSGVDPDVPGVDVLLPVEDDDWVRRLLRSRHLPAVGFLEKEIGIGATRRTKAGASKDSNSCHRRQRKAARTRGRLPFF
uniref:Uncharacterized protein n=1 Tax=Nymphaea colorata TaxID=210225 RepID=A0A5K0V964_9MAGN